MNFCSLARAIHALRLVALGALFGSFFLGSLLCAFPADSPEIRTPKPAPAPRINGPCIFGVRPNAPFLYRIPATGSHPIQFAVAPLPAGLHLDSNSGEITGSLKEPGEYT